MIIESLILLACLLPVSYVLAMRVAKPHSKKMARPTSSTTTSAGEQKWFMKYLWTIVLAVIGLVVFFQGVYLSEWKSPSFTTVGNWSWSHWLPLLVLWGIGAALLALNKKALVTAEPILQSLLAGIMAMLFLVCPVIGWFEGPSTPRPQAAISAPQECSKVHHCVLREQDDGSTERVSVPKGKTLCLDGSSWNNRDKLGLRSTYQGGPEVVHTCTRDQVVSGTCREPNLDSFRFVPKEEVRIPRYWFVLEGTGC